MGSWAKNTAYLTIYFTTEHGYGSGYDYHDDDADMNLGMAVFLYGQLEAENGIWHMGGGPKALGALATFHRCITLA